MEKVWEAYKSLCALDHQPNNVASRTLFSWLTMLLIVSIVTLWFFAYVKILF